MITLTSELEQFMKGQNLEGLKPFAVLLRNKWVEEESASESESGSVGHYELDTANPIDISDLIVKPNTLSMTLDVNEVAQYNANNVTLTLSDTRNQLVEGTENSFFPSGYQLYGSRVVLYYGTDNINRTPLFTGVIKDLPTYKPEQYQVELKLVSPLEMLKDIEAKDFSDKVTGETLTYKSTDSDGHRIYWTTGTGVGGFDAVYADGTKLFEGVDYEISQTSSLGLPALVTLLNVGYNSSTITADYYTWKKNLTVEQIIAGLVALAGYSSGTEDIRNVVWNTAVRGQVIPSVTSAIGYKQNGTTLTASFGGSAFYGSYGTYNARFNTFPTNFKIKISFKRTNDNPPYPNYILGSTSDGTYCAFYIGTAYNTTGIGAELYVNNSRVAIWREISNTYANTTITYLNGVLTVSGDAGTGSYTVALPLTGSINESLTDASFAITSYELSELDANGNELYTIGSNPSVVFDKEQLPAVGDTWYGLSFTMSDDTAGYQIYYRTEDGVVGNWTLTDKSAALGISNEYLRFRIDMSSYSTTSDISDWGMIYLSSELLLQLVNLSGKTVLEALQDFALISGYEFGVDRNGVFFFKPRIQSTTPMYILDHNEIVKVDTVKKNLSDFFTKLTLTFAQVPLEFYANTGQPPNLVDKYGIINKEIDKPDIVNYDNPELAQAIGPQLLEVYSSLPNVIQVTGKLNLALELGDIVSLQRNYSLIEPNSASDYVKFINQQTYYRACKITGMNYNFAKKQITYTLRDVSNTNNMPGPLFNEYVYDYPIEFGVKE